MEVTQILKQVEDILKARGWSVDISPAINADSRHGFILTLTAPDETLYLCRAGESDSYIADRMGSSGMWGNKSKAIKRTKIWWQTNVDPYTLRFCVLVPVTLDNHATNV
jgi:hypothetical protein